MNTGDPKKDERSRRKLAGTHPKLSRLVNDFAAVSPVQFIVTEGLRTLDRQRELVAAGASKTLNSKHLLGRAVDLAPVVSGEVRFDWPLYWKLGPALEEFAKAKGVGIVWGGRWPHFPDGPHFELAEGE